MANYLCDTETMATTLQNDEQRLARIAELKAQIDADRAELLALIPQVFPEKRGEEAVRGRLNEVVRITGWTREHVARIRDGKVGAQE